MYSHKTPFLSAFTCLILATLVLPPAAMGESALPQVPSDWNLYMMRLVNRARTDPSGEDTRQGTSYGKTATHPLAYDDRVGRAAQNHCEWMGLNRDNNWPPTSFTHTEWSPSTGFTGSGIGDRLDYVGFNWDRGGENIRIVSAPQTIDQSQMDADHAGWWNSDGHRSNMMNGDFNSFGHASYNDPSSPPTRRYWSTQNFGRPASWLEEPNYLFGLVFDDLDSSGSWEPFDTGDPNRESLGGVDYDVYDANTANLQSSGQTMANGAYSIQIADGTYDIVFDLPGIGLYTLEDITMSGVNNDVGDLDVSTIPEPATMGLLAIGGIGLLIRKRRKAA